ncbi:MAG: hypothetical protein EBT13_14320 [Rhodobacteraceae bacterium]|nr:hypothetical protein [Paracoccaceae bacterium]
MSTPTIQYKGEIRPLVIGNAAMMRFARLGGQLDQLERDPVTQAITLACAALDLPGDPIDHADHFPPVGHLADAIRQAVEIYNDGAPGEPLGDVPAQSPKSAMA